MDKYARRECVSHHVLSSELHYLGILLRYEMYLDDAQSYEDRQKRDFMLKVFIHKREAGELGQARTYGKGSSLLRYFLLGPNLEVQLLHELNRHY